MLQQKNNMINISMIKLHYNMKTDISYNFNTLNPCSSSQPPKELLDQVFVMEQSKDTPKLAMNEILSYFRVTNYKQ